MLSFYQRLAAIVEDMNRAGFPGEVTLRAFVEGNADPVIATIVTPAFAARAAQREATRKTF